MWGGRFSIARRSFSTRHEAARRELEGLVPEELATFITDLDAGMETIRQDGLQSVAALCKGVLIADLIAILASLDPNMGDCDR